MLDIATILDFATRGGAVSMLIIALIGGMRGWYLWKGAHDTIVQGYKDRIATIEQECTQQTTALRDDRDYWRAQAMTALGAAYSVTNKYEEDKKR